MDDGWIVIPNWRRFQHYKNRIPKWIKVYTELTSDPAFLGLAPAERGLLISLWLEYTNSRGLVQVRRGFVTSLARQRFRKGHLKALIDAGFIEVSASKPLAKRKQNASPELLRNSREATSPSNPGTASPQKQLLAAGRRYVADWKGGPSDAFDEGLDELEQLVGARFQQGDRYRLWDEAVDRSRMH